MDGNKLINKAHSSTSNYVWSIKTRGSLIYIENKEKNKVLELQIGAYDLEDQFNEDYHYSGDKINGDDEDYYYSGDKLIEDNKPSRSARDSFGLIEADFVEDNPKQLWKKVKPDGDTESYFFLGSSENAEKVLSATSASALEIRSM